ncbi:conserved hypothetical protein [Vibrio phage 277E43-1]|nr:conserved hypothetical protein [Vibrio phage 277E43-1]
MKAYQYEIVSKQPIAYFFHWKGGVRKVKITDCDFNKHVEMVCQDTGEEFSYKWGYVYNTEEDAVLAEKYHTVYDSMDCTQWLRECPNCIDPWKLLLSNKNYSLYKKTKRKEQLAQNKWFVAVDEDSYYTSKKFRTQKAALNYFRTLDNTISYASLGEHNVLGNLLEFEDNELWWVPKGSYGHHGKGKDKRTLKSRHFGKNETYKQWRK